MLCATLCPRCPALHCFWKCTERLVPVPTFQTTDHSLLPHLKLYHLLSISFSPLPASCRYASQPAAHGDHTLLTLLTCSMGSSAVASTSSTTWGGLEGGGAAVGAGNTNSTASCSSSGQFCVRGATVHKGAWAGALRVRYACLQEQGPGGALLGARKANSTQNPPPPAAAQGSSVIVQQIRRGRDRGRGRGGDSAEAVCCRTMSRVEHCLVQGERILPCNPCACARQHVASGHNACEACSCFRRTLLPFEPLRSRL